MADESSRKLMDRWRNLRARIAGPAAEDRNRQQRFTVIEGFFLVAFVVVASVAIPVIIQLGVTGLKRTVALSDTIENLEQLRNYFLGLAGLVGAVFGLYQLANSATRTRLTKIDTDTKREAERNDRYVKAVELLKDPDDSVRMGGIYALRKLATEDNGEYFKTVLKVLSAYVRYRTNAEDRDGNTIYPPRAKAGAKPTPGAEGGAPLNAEWVDKARPTEPVKAAIEALNELWKSRQEGSVDLRGTFLTGIEVDDADFRSWELGKAHLEGALLGGAHLEGAGLGGAHLEGARLGGAHLEGAWLGGAHLEGAWLKGAHLEGARLGGAHLEGAWLWGAHLEGARLLGAHLNGALVMGAHLEDAKLGAAELEGADLSGANLSGANLAGARLLGANLLDANLIDADLRGVHLEGAQVTGAQLNVAVWATGSPPESFPDGLSAEMFDKSWCTNPAIPQRLLLRKKWGTPPDWPEDDD